MVTKISMRATLAGMKPGEVVTIPMEMRGYNYLRNCASLLGVAYPGRKYSVSVDREKQQSKVTRVQ